MIYYIQAFPLGFRRYNEAGEGARWEPQEKAWSGHCAPERTCVRTEDEKLTEEEFAARYPAIPL